jgi:hypothetical protein
LSERARMGWGGGRGLFVTFRYSDEQNSGNDQQVLTN